MGTGLNWMSSLCLTNNGGLPGRLGSNDRIASSPVCGTDCRGILSETADKETQRPEGTGRREERIRTKLRMTWSTRTKCELVKIMPWVAVVEIPPSAFDNRAGRLDPGVVRNVILRMNTARQNGLSKKPETRLNCITQKQ